MRTETSGRVKLWGALLMAVLVIAAAIPALYASLRGNHAPEVKVQPPPRKPEPTYAVHAGLDGEVFPALANYASLQRPQDRRRFATVTVTVSNSSDVLVTNRISVLIPGWSDPEIQLVEVAAGQVRTARFAPTFHRRLYTNREIAIATAVVSISDIAGKLLMTMTVPVRLRAAEDMYWGPEFEYARFIASWVTPHDPNVEDILGRAKEFMPGRRLPGYESWKSPEQQRQSASTQAKAIYRALQGYGISYVKSSLTLGGHQGTSERVRRPRESLSRLSANCIDGAVLYASLFENLGMEPVIVLVPGHAYVGVREGEQLDSYLYIETSLTGRSGFQDAVRAAQRGLARFRPDQVQTISISQARAEGIYPMPSPARSGNLAVSSPAK